MSSIESDKCNKNKSEIKEILSWLLTEESKDGANVWNKIFSCTSELRKAQNSSEKTSNLNQLFCLLALVDEFSSFDGIKGELLNLCEQGYLNRRCLYLALAARNDNTALCGFLDIDRNYLREDNLIFKGLIHPQRDLIMELFLLSTKRQSHWILDLFEIATKLLTDDSVDDVENLLKSSPLTLIWPLLLFHFSRPPWNGDVLGVILNNVLGERKFDPALTEFAESVRNQLKVTSWLNELNIITRPVSLNALLTHTSTLTFLHQVCTLSDLNWDVAHNFLSQFSQQGGFVAPWEVSTFDAFSVCLLAIKFLCPASDVDMACPKSENLRSQNVEKLNKIKLILHQLQPLPLRIEVMENIFSFLFLRYEDFDVEVSCESGEEEVKCNFQSNRVSSSGMQTDNSTSPMPSLLRATENAILSAAQKHRRRGFVCGRYAAQEILQILHTCLVESGAANYSSLSVQKSFSNNTASVITVNSVQTHINQLTLYVTEALWRLEALTKRKSKIESQRCKLQSSQSGDWLYTYCLDENSSSDEESEEKLLQCTAAKKKCDAEKCSESSSQTNVQVQTPASAKRLCKCHRRKSFNYVHSNGPSDNIIKKMLSSKFSIVSQCLTRGDLGMAKELIQRLDIEGSDIAAEVYFMEECHQLQHKLFLCIDDCDKLYQHAGHASTLKKIQRVASAGVQASTLNNKVEGLLTNVPLPQIPGIDSLPSEILQLVGGSPREYSVALAGADLALIMSANSQQALSFLGIASKYSKELHKILTTLLPRSNNIGFLSLTRNLLEGKRECDLERPLDLLHRWDLPNFAFCYSSFWDELKAAHADCFQSKNYIVFPKLVQLINSSPFAKSESSLPEVNYLFGLQKYITLLDCVTQQKSLSTASDFQISKENIFLLEKSLSSLVSQLVLDRNISPKSLEEPASALKCSLPHLLAVNSCFPGLIPPAISSRPTSNVVVLNSCTFFGPARQPLDVVESLLSEMLRVLMKHGDGKRQQSTSGFLTVSSIDVEFLSSVFEATWELAVLNLDELQTGSESLVFYCNLANLMWIHSLLQLKLISKGDYSSFKLWGNNVEQIAAQLSVFYHIGGLGLVSLREIRNLALGAKLILPSGPSALCRILPSVDCRDSRALFAVGLGTGSSPRIKVLHVQTLEAELTEALQDYVNFWTVIDSDQIITPFLVHLYAKHVDEDVKNILFQYWKVAEGNKLRFSTVSEYVETKTDPFVLLKYEGKAFKQEHSPSESVTVEKFIDPRVLSYISEKCALLAVLLKELNSEKIVADCDSDDPEEATEIDEHRFYSQSFQDYPVLQTLCKSLDILHLSPLFSNNYLLCALHSIIPSELLWRILESHFLESDWRKSFQMLDSLPKIQLEEDAMLSVVYDIVLMELAFNVDDSPDPWFYCEKIRTFRLLVQCVLAGCSVWPGPVCLSQLQILLQNPELECWPTMRQKVIEMNHRINTYQKILDAVQDGPWASWQEVEKSIQTNPTIVLNHVIDLQDAELCLSCINLNNIMVTAPHLIDNRLLLVLLNAEKRFVLSAEKILARLSLTQACGLCKDMLCGLKSICALQSCAHFLSEVCQEELTDGDKELLELISFGIQMIDALSENEQVDYIHLVKTPHLILEQLLMNMHLEAAERVLAKLRPQLHCASKPSFSLSAIDLMVRHYAAKALDFKGVQKFFGSSSNDKSCTISTHSSGTEFVMPEVVPPKSKWVRNEETSVCMLCQIVTFSMFNRRHHCRRCGRVICAACSGHRMVVDSYGDFKVRVCNTCYTQTQEHQDLEQTFSSERSTTSQSLDNSLEAEDIWLFSDPLTVDTIREEFSYEYAPSVSLCLSILQLHSESANCPSFLLDSCRNILNSLRPDSQGSVISNPEVDYALIIQMCRSLVIAAKVKCAQWGYNTGERDSGSLLTEIDLLNILVSHGYPHFFPPKTDIHSLYYLRNKLIEKGLWELALEVSIRCRMECNVVLVAWGMGCLRAGRWADARAKFALCLTKNEKGLSRYKDTSHLAEILQILESTLYNTAMSEPIHLVEKSASGGRSADSSATSDSHKLPVSTEIGDNRRRKRLQNRTPALAVLHSLKSLKNISEGKFTQATKSKFILDPVVYSECCYYLCEYGSPATYLGFLVRHRDLTAALNYVLNNSVSSQHFFEWVYLPCLQIGQMEHLHDQMTKLDSSLNLWKSYIHGVCAALEKRQYLHTLYEVQKWSEDHVRAAMTCIRFYHRNATSYKDLESKSIYLRNAQNHLEAGLEVASGSTKLEHKGEKKRQFVLSENSPECSKEIGLLHLSPNELDHHLSTIWHQLELMKYFSHCEAHGRSILKVAVALSPSDLEKLEICPPTLFGSKFDRYLLAVLSILCGKNVEEGYGMAFRIIDNFNLKAQEIYEAVGVALVRSNRTTEIQQLVDCIRSSGESSIDQMCDSLVYSCVTHLPDQPDPEHVSLLVRNITDSSMKIKAYICCHQLKSAYLLAVKNKRLEDVELILNEAERLGQTAIQNICLKRLGRS